MTLASKLDVNMLDFRGQSLADLEMRVVITREIGYKACSEQRLQILTEGTTCPQESYVAGLLDFCISFYNNNKWYPGRVTTEVSFRSMDEFYASRFGKLVEEQMRQNGERLNKDRRFRKDVFTQFHNRFLGYANYHISLHARFLQEQCFNYANFLLTDYERALSIGLSPAFLRRDIVSINPKVFKADFKERYDRVIAALGPAQRVAKPG